MAEYSTQVATQQDAKVCFLTSDHLGSPRINTDQNGLVTARHDYQPFGEEIQRASYGADTVRQGFTGYEKDGETDLDFAQARYHNSGLGRFQSPDPILMKEKRLTDQQSINLYIYTRNNPLRYVDPDGREWVDENGTRITVEVDKNGRLKVSCEKCKDQNSKQLQSLMKLATMINNTGSLKALKQFMAIDASKGKVHLILGSNTVAKTGGLHQPHGKRDGGTSGPLEWVYNDPNDPTDDGFNGTPDTIIDDNGNEVYAEVAITLDEALLSNSYKTDPGAKGLTLGDYIVAQFGHESEHNLDLQQVQFAKNRVTDSANYHKGRSAATQEQIKTETRRSKTFFRRENEANDGQLAPNF